MTVVVNMPAAYLARHRFATSSHKSQSVCQVQWAVLETWFPARLKQVKMLQVKLRLMSSVRPNRA